MIGVVLIGTPDGVEVVNLTAAVLLTIAFVPYGIQLIRSEHPDTNADRVNANMACSRRRSRFERAAADA